MNAWHTPFVSSFQPTNEGPAFLLMEAGAFADLTGDGLIDAIGGRIVPGKR